MTAQLYGYMNSDAFNADELNGGGLNFFPIEPVSFDSFQPYVVMVMTTEMQSIFDGCPDLVVSCDPNLVTVRQVARTHVVRA